MRTKAMAFGVALACLAGMLPAWATEPTPAENAARAVIGVLFDVVHVDTVMRDVAIKGAEKQDPGTRDLVVRVLGAADMATLQDEIAGPIGLYLTPDDVAALQGFADRPAVQTLRQLAVTHTTRDDLIAAVGALPKERQQEIDQLLGAPAVQHVLAAMRSPDAREATQHWSERQVCDYVRAHPDQYSIDRLIAMGQCKAQ